MSSILSITRRPVEDFSLRLIIQQLWFAWCKVCRNKFGLRKLLLKEKVVLFSYIWRSHVPFSRWLSLLVMYTNNVRQFPQEIRKVIPDIKLQQRLVSQARYSLSRKMILCCFCFWQLSILDTTLTQKEIEYMILSINPLYWVITDIASIQIQSKYAQNASPRVHVHMNSNSRLQTAHKLDVDDDDGLIREDLEIYIKTAKYLVRKLFC